MPKLQHGCIILAETPDPQGRNSKERPLVVVSEEAAIQAGEPLVCIAITTQIPKNPLPHQVILPYANSGYSETGLRARCAADCSWSPTLNQDDVKRVLGNVPPAKLQAIKEIIKSMI
jgi:mRNA-degrading endonuclease toxin of MazEF toxin-antitoxin module